MGRTQVQMQNETQTKWYAQIKYSKIAIPIEYEFKTEQETLDFCNLKKKGNPYVRWCRANSKREYLYQPLGNK